MPRNKTSAPTTPAAPVSFEERLERLQAITQSLEQGDLSLEKSLELYQEGVKLSRELRVLLDQARNVARLHAEDGLRDFAETDFSGKPPEGNDDF